MSPESPSSQGRSVLSYVMLPRPQELGVKSGFVLVGYAAGRWASHGAGSPVAVVATAVLAIEFLAYQARYMINDLLDAALDVAHPARIARGRLVIEDRRTRSIVGISAFGRAILALGVTVLLPGRERVTTIVAVVGVFVIAVPYEAVRQRLRRPASPQELSCLDRYCLAAYVLVGAGYALRTAAGLALAGAPWWSLVLAVLFAWPFGVTFVTMTWALEATSFVAADWGSLGDGLRWKRHLGPLLAAAGFLPLPVPPPPTAPNSTAVLSPPANWRAPWSAAALVAGVGAALLGSGLAAGWQWSQLWRWPTAGVLAVSIAGTVASLRAVPSRAVSRLALILAVPVAAIVVSAIGDVPRPLLAGLPIGAIMATAIVMRAFSYRELVSFGSRPVAVVVSPVES